MINANVVLCFKCDNSECPDHTVYRMNTEDLVSCGTPICGICEHDAEYVGYEE